MEQPKPTLPKPPEPDKQPPEEIGGAKRRTDPTRYDDWEINGKCVDF